MRSGGGGARAYSADREAKGCGVRARRSSIVAARGVAARVVACRVKRGRSSTSVVGGVVAELAGRRLGVGSAG
jgi:hypothetical protein